MWSHARIAITIASVSSSQYRSRALSMLARRVSDQDPRTGAERRQPLLRTPSFNSSDRPSSAASVSSRETSSNTGGKSVRVHHLAIALLPQSDRLPQSSS